MESRTLAFDWHRNQWFWLTLNAKIGILLTFGNFRLRHTFQQRLVPKSLQIDQDTWNFWPSLNLGFLRLRNHPYGGVKLSYSFKMRVFGRSNGSSYARPFAPSGVCEWMKESHRFQCQMLGSVSLDFVRSGPSNMHRCRMLTLSVNWAFLF